MNQNIAIAGITAPIDMWLLCDHFLGRLLDGFANHRESANDGILAQLRWHKFAVASRCIRFNSLDVFEYIATIHALTSAHND